MSEAIIRTEDIDPKEINNYFVETEKDREIVIASVTQNGFYLEFADDSLKNDPEISTISNENICMQYQNQDSNKSY